MTIRFLAQKERLRPSGYYFAEQCGLIKSLGNPDHNHKKWVEIDFWAQPHNSNPDKDFESQNSVGIL